MNESDMKKALGLDRSASFKKAKGAALTPGLTVILSVREPYGGPLQRFGFVSNTLSRLQAQIDAEKAARAQGFTVWAVIDIYQREQPSRDKASE